MVLASYLGQAWEVALALVQDALPAMGGSSWRASRGGIGVGVGIGVGAGFHLKDMGLGFIPL